MIKSLNAANHLIDIDVASAESIQNGLKDIKSKYHTVPSIIVNAAGIIKDNFILKINEQDFDDVIRVNLKVESFGANLLTNLIVWMISVHLGNISGDAKFC